MDEMIRTNDVIRDEAEDREAIYLPPYYFSESGCAKTAASVDVLWKEEIWGYGRNTEESSSFIRNYL